MTRPRLKAAHVLACALLTGGALSGCGNTDAAIETVPAWHNPQVNAVSRTVSGAGVAATTSLQPNGTLETVALDLATGQTLWAHPTTMVGRLPGMGVQPPALVDLGDGRGVIASLAPGKHGKWNATLVARDARTGRRLWTRPVHSTFGPQPCGDRLCMAENTALSSARMVVMDPATGRVEWRMRGIAEVEWADRTRLVVLRMAAHPVLEARALATGKRLWRLPVEQALGTGVDLSGGWSFGATDKDLVGYIAPYTDPVKRTVSTFGFFSVRLADGAVNWMRPSVVRVYPSGNPGVAPVVRPVDRQGRFGGFAVLEPDSGRVTGQISAAQVPGPGWWLAFPSRLDQLGFLRHGTRGTVFDLPSGRTAPVEGRRGWSFCVTDPKPLKLTGIAPGFYPVAALCEYDLATGKRVPDAGAPPLWFTGSQNGWRIWRDEKGGLHALKDADTTLPGMYG